MSTVCEIKNIVKKPKTISDFHPDDFKPAYGDEIVPYSGTLGRTYWEQIAKIIIEYNQNEYKQEQDENKRRNWEWKRIKEIPEEYEYDKVSMIEEEYLEGNEEEGYMLTIDALEKIKAKHPAEKLA